MANNSHLLTTIKAMIEEEYPSTFEIADVIGTIKK